MHPIRLIRHARDFQRTRLFSLIKQKSYSQTVLLTDKNTNYKCKPHLESFLSFDVHLSLPLSGEAVKTPDTLHKIIDALLDNRIDRHSALVVLGGGTLTDLGGLVASVYKRGLHLYLIPTTLLAMVDAAIGGKNGLNLGDLKNQLGTVYFPHEVILDPQYLNTLPRDQWLSGWAEMFKHGLIASPRHLKGLLDIPTGQMAGNPHFNRLIWQSAAIKMRIVRSDPYENGPRKWLNFGHSIGHALETCARLYGRPLSHGHAVAVGMMAELYLSVQTLGLDPGLATRYTDRLKQVFSVPRMDGPMTDCILEKLKHDKKNRNGQSLFVLLKAPGKPVHDKKIPESLIRESLRIIQA